MLPEEHLQSTPEGIDALPWSILPAEVSPHRNQRQRDRRRLGIRSCLHRLQGVFQQRPRLVGAIAGDVDIRQSRFQAREQVAPPTLGPLHENQRILDHRYGAISVDVPVPESARQRDGRDGEIAVFRVTQIEDLRPLDQLRMHLQGPIPVPALGRAKHPVDQPVPLGIQVQEAPVLRRCGTDGLENDCVGAFRRVLADRPDFDTVQAVGGSHDVEKLGAEPSLATAHPPQRLPRGIVDERDDVQTPLFHSDLDKVAGAGRELEAIDLSTANPALERPTDHDRVGFRSDRGRLRGHRWNARCATDGGDERQECQESHGERSGHTLSYFQQQTKRSRISAALTERSPVRRARNPRYRRTHSPECVRADRIRQEPSALPLRETNG